MIGYTENDNFPSAISVVVDADPPCATDTMTAVEGLADRTKFMQTRLVAALGSPPDLSTITGMRDGDTRALVGWGFYVFRSASATIADGIWVVPAAGGGQWLANDYAQPTTRLMASETVTYQGPAIIPSFSGTPKTCLDPALRAGSSTATGIQIVASANTYDLEVDDLLVVSYTVPWFLVNNTFASDAVIGVSLRTGPDFHTDSFPEQFIDNSAQTTASASGPLASSGINYTTNSIEQQRFTIARTGQYRLASPQTPAKIILVIACDAHIHGEVLQGASLSIAHYRTLL